VDVTTFSLRTQADAEAVRDVVGSAQLLLCFGDSDPRVAAPLIEALAARFAQAVIIGCSTSGEIFGDAILDGTVSGAVVGFEGTALATASASVEGPEGSFAAGEAVARALARPDLRGVLVLSDGLKVNGSELVRGISATLPPQVVVTGGLAGDGDRFQRTWVIRDGRPVSGAVTALGMYGDAVPRGCRRARCCSRWRSATRGTRRSRSCARCSRSTRPRSL
jgi:hypothetical protein